MHESHSTRSVNTDEKIEKTDVRFGGILVSLGALTLFILGSVVICYGCFKALEFYMNYTDKAVSVMFESKIQLPEPRLQTLPAQDLMTVNDEEKKIIEGYAVIDSSAGIARIPVARAMQMLAEKPDVFLREAKPAETDKPVSEK